MPLTVTPRAGGERVMNVTVSGTFDRNGRMQEQRWLFSQEIIGVATDDLEEIRRRLLEAEHARKRAESALRSMADLMGWASHEIRTPAASIGGYTDILAMGVRGMPTPEQQAILARIQQAQTHLVGLLDDLLTFSRAGAGQLHLDIEEVAIQPILDRLLTMMAPQAAQRDVELTIGHVDALTFRCDGERMLQILLNLVGNAIKFAPLSGLVRIECRAEGDCGIVTVEDSGTGIPTEERDRVFHPYVQLGVPHHARLAGAGLGLAISRELARAMAGDLTCIGAADRGAVFALRLPRRVGFGTASGRP
jgi:signal transduction histidine kinase